MFLSSSYYQQSSLRIHWITTLWQLNSCNRLWWSCVPILDCFIPTTSDDNIALIQKLYTFDGILVLCNLNWLTSGHVKHSTCTICSTRGYFCAILSSCQSCIVSSLSTKYTPCSSLRIIPALRVQMQRVAPLFLLTGHYKHESTWMFMLS